VDSHHLLLAGLPAHLCENAQPNLISVENGRSQPRFLRFSSF
jgi:hypothetical protein